MNDLWSKQKDLQLLLFSFVKWVNFQHYLDFFQILATPSLWTPGAVGTEFCRSAQAAPEPAEPWITVVLQQRGTRITGPRPIHRIVHWNCPLLKIIFIRSVRKIHKRQRFMSKRQTEEFLQLHPKKGREFTGTHTFSLQGSERAVSFYPKLPTTCVALFPST